MKLWSLELRCVMFSNKITQRAICFSSRGRILAPFANHYSSPLSAQNEKNNLVSRLRHRNKVLLTYLLTNLVSFAVKGTIHRECLRVTGFVTLQTSLIFNKFI